MTNGTNLLSKFELSRIPPTPRDVPHIEVVSDIDANGILNVSVRKDNRNVQPHHDHQRRGSFVRGTFDHPTSYIKYWLSSRDLSLLPLLAGAYLMTSSDNGKFEAAHPVRGGVTEVRDVAIGSNVSL